MSPEQVEQHKLEMKKKAIKNSLLLFDYDRYAVPHAQCSYSLPDRSLAIVEFENSALLLFDYENNASMHRIYRRNRKQSQ
jgi:hypothetical protein